MSNASSISLGEVVKQVQRATVDPKHPFRWPALASVSPELGPEARIVVLRRASQDELEIFTDARSSKCASIECNPEVELLFFDSKRRLQVRVRGEATIIREESELAPRWSKLPLDRQAEYQTTESPGSNWTQASASQDTELGMRHFAVIRVKANTYETLQLQSDTHIRQRFHRTDGDWRLQRIIP